LSQLIADDFPIRCKAEDEAPQLIKLPGSSNASNAYFFLLIDQFRVTDIEAKVFLEIFS
jgi:hypothetical protein